ncbi:MAG: hypothetical protein Q3993_05895 [Filifactor alocis]|nr:hypothetical protein [Filifactor alocis]
MKQGILRKKRGAFLIGTICSYLVVAAVFFGIIYRMRQTMPEDLQLEQQMVYDKDDIRVKAVGIEVNLLLDTQLEFEVENNSQTAYQVTPYFMAVDGIMVAPPESEKKIVEPGEKRVVGLSMGDLAYSEFLNREEMGEIKLDLYLIDKASEENDHILIQDITLHTNYFGKNQTPDLDLEGELFVQKEGLVVNLVKQDGQPIKSHQVLMTAENTSDRDMYFYTSEFQFGDKKPKTEILIPVRAHSKSVVMPYGVVHLILPDGELKEGDPKLKSVGAVMDYRTHEVIGEQIDLEWN